GRSPAAGSSRPDPADPPRRPRPASLPDAAGCGVPSASFRSVSPTVIGSAMSSSTLALVVRHPKLKALYGLWLRLCAGGSFPALDGMSPADLRPWLDNMAILGLDET